MDKDARDMEPNSPFPTDAELDILCVLWELGPSTVRRVHDVISRSRPIGYTTVLKQMQVMHTKKLLKRRNDSRSHVYEPCHPRAQVQRTLVRQLLYRAFGGSARTLVQSALGGRPVSKRELDEIRKLLDDYERGGK